MNKENKRQLIYSNLFLVVLIVTLVLWFNNFMFHTYVDTVDFQYYYAGATDTLSVDGYTFSQNKHIKEYSGAQIIALDEGVFQKDDIVDAVMIISTEDGNIEFKQSYTILADDEVLTLKEETTDEPIDEMKKIESFKVSITRKGKVVYEDNIPLSAQEVKTYAGATKEYTIQNVYVTSSWMKTGTLSTNVKQLQKEYPYISMDYVYSLDENITDINDYERFLQIRGKTTDVLKNETFQSAFLSEDGSLFDADLKCVVTLSKEESFSEGYVFIIDLNAKTLKAGDVNE